MIRFFPICIIYHNQHLWANVIEKHLSPSTFHISFLDESNTDIAGDIILNTINGKLEPAEGSPRIDGEMLKLVTVEIEEYLRNHPLSSDFRI